MFAFLLVSALVLALLGFGVFAIPLLIVGAVLWLVLLPIKFLVFVVGALFRVVFGVVGALLGLVLAPLVLIVGGLAVAGAVIVALLALLTPLLPVVLVLLLGWGLYRVAIRPTPAL